MANPKSFTETVRQDLKASPEFRRALLGETINCMASGDVETGKVVLREYVNGTLGFVALGKALSKSPKSLMRMLSPEGNPNVKNLFEMIAYLQKVEGTVLRFEATAA